MSLNKDVPQLATQRAIPRAALCFGRVAATRARRPKWRCLAWLTLTLSLTGCGGGRIYHPSSLPAEFIAPQFSSLQRVDLSRMGQSLSDNELLYPGDLVAVTISTGLEKEAPTAWKGRIAEDGTANIPLVGPVPIAGLRLNFAEQMIHNESINRGKFVNPNVTVEITQRRSNNVTVVGAVKKPGTYLVPTSNSNVLAAITMAEGLTEDADTIIEVRHPAGGDAPALASQDRNAPSNAPPGGTMELAGFRRDQTGGAPPRATRLDLEQITRTGQADLHVEDGSTVMVMKRPKRFVHIIGLVNKPDQIEMPVDQEFRLLDAIAKGNGRKLEVADKVRVIRNVSGRTEPVIIEASIRAAKTDATSNFRLAPGDVVSVEETPTTFVIGTVRDFVRFGFSSAIPGF